jgi:hypothetical protein
MLIFLRTENQTILAKKDNIVICLKFEGWNRQCADFEIRLTASAVPE